MCVEKTLRGPSGKQKTLEGSRMGGSSPVPAAFSRRTQRKHIPVFQTFQREEFSHSCSSALASLLSPCLGVLRPKSIQLSLERSNRSFPAVPLHAPRGCARLGQSLDAFSIRFSTLGREEVLLCI